MWAGNIHSDIGLDEMDRDLSAGDPPTLAESSLVQAYRFGHITKDVLMQKLGPRWPIVAMHKGIMASKPDLSMFFTRDLEDELKRRNG